MREDRWEEGQVDLARRYRSYEAFVAAGGTQTKAAFHSQRCRLKRRGEMVQMADRAETVVGHQTVNQPATPDEFRRLFDLIKEADSLKQDLSPTQESTDFHAPDDGLPIGIAFTGDWHAGASGVAYDQLEADLKLIGSTPGCYPVGMGDFAEGVTLTAKANSALFGGAFNEMDMQDGVIRLLADHARGKWLAWVMGNHEAWMERAVGTSLPGKQARYLEAPFFRQGGGTIFVHVGSEKYVVAVAHSWRGRAMNTTNAQRRAFDEWPQWENCDAICLGHLHFTDRHRVPRKGGVCEYLRSGTYKVRGDTYAQDRGFTPGMGTPGVVLYPDRHECRGWDGDNLEGGLEFLLREREKYRKR